MDSTGISAASPAPIAPIYSTQVSLPALVSVVVLFLLCSFAFFLCCWLGDHYHANDQDHGNLRRHIDARLSGNRRRASTTPPASGLEAAAVAALPKVTIAGGGGEMCAVCLVEYGGKQKVKMIPGCGHVFHPECIDAWLRWRGSCPVCRSSELWGSWSGGGEYGERKQGRSRSGELCCDSVEEGVDRGGGAIALRRTCSV
ncbi:RING-H2 finger protein ATL11 [Platanthera guangdongensis]|uniref:RING-type E3 ubiquitin transferase n=1 Tax=Platanthera guangdongensis TaxID=2320717 RepID=A0ABR2LP19_9ASPA